jgi:hypothetical protein
VTNAQHLAIVRTLHTAIYVVMVSAIGVVLFAGVTGARGWWLWLSLALLAIETVVFTSSGLRCPLTATVTRFADGDPVSDTYFPERFTRHTLSIFGPLMVIGVILVAVRLALAR